MTSENLAARTAFWLDEIRTGVSSRRRFALRPDRAALIIVDMNRCFAAENGTCHLCATDAILPRIQSLLAAWRKQGGLVVFTRHGHLPNRDPGIMGRFFGRVIWQNTLDWHLIDDLTPLSGETIVDKSTYDAFLDTSLQSLLEENGATQVVICGVLTNMCCETTARSAFCRGFEVFVPADATAANLEERHLHSLKGMAAAVAMILSTGEILECLPS